MRANKIANTNTTNREANLKQSDLLIIPQIEPEINKAKSYASDASKASAEAIKFASMAEKAISAAEKVIGDAKNATLAKTDFKLAIETLRKSKIASKKAQKAANEAKTAHIEAEKVLNRAKASTKLPEAQKLAVEAKRATDKARQARIAAEKTLQETKSALGKVMEDAMWKIFSSNKKTKRKLNSLWGMFKGKDIFVRYHRCKYIDS